MSGPIVWCPQCQRPGAPGDIDCQACGRPLEPMAVPDQRPRAVDDDDEARPRSVCWRCGQVSPDRRNVRCTNCKESLIPPALVLAYADGNLVALDRPHHVHQTGRASRAELGRLGSYREAYLGYPTVSRRHASLAVDAEGRCWIEPISAAVNGTWVNGIEIKERAELHATALVRFAATGPEGRVRRPDTE